MKRKSKRQGVGRAMPTTESKLGQRCVERNLLTLSPNTEQFEPTDQSPIRQHQKMAGAG